LTAAADLPFGICQNGLQNLFKVVFAIVELVWTYASCRLREHLARDLRNE
jgi:hypothetical protein